MMKFWTRDSPSKKSCAALKCITTFSAWGPLQPVQERLPKSAVEIGPFPSGEHM